MSGVCRTKVRDARECLSVLRIKLRKKIQKREGDKKKNTPLATVGKKTQSLA